MAMAKSASLNRDIIRLYVRASLHNKLTVCGSLLSPLGSILTTVGVPFYAGKALASILQHDNNRFHGIMLKLIIVVAVSVVANRIGFNSLMALQATTMSKLHSLVFERLLRRGSSFHNNHISGKLVSDALDFVSAYSTLLLAAYNTGFSLLATIVAGLLIVTINAWQLGVFLLVIVSIIFVWSYFDSRTRSHLRTVRLQATKKLTGHLSDSIVNAQTVKTFAAEPREIATNNHLNHKLLQLRLNDWRRSGRSGNNRLATLLVMVVVLLLLIHQLAKNNPAILGTGIFAFTYTFTLLLRLFDINNLTRQVEESFLQATPVIQMLQEEDEIQDKPGANSLQVREGTVQLSHVDFTYADASGAQAVFKDFNLSINPGEKIGLVGPSGGGKSTLTRLLLRFEDIQAGTITIDGQNIADVTQTSLREAIGYVPQEPLLFHRSIKENIRYGKPDASEDEIIAAAKKAFAHEFIEQLPKGYDTVVGERGVKLSGGQRQRVAIARAMLKNAPILLLDEATSALDSESEVVIQQALWELMQGKTVIVIAHRLSTIQRLDRIIVLNDGKLIEEGPHQALLEHKGLYAKLWAHQSGGFLES